MLVVVLLGVFLLIMIRGSLPIYRQGYYGYCTCVMYVCMGYSHSKSKFLHTVDSLKNRVCTLSENRPVDIQQSVIIGIINSMSLSKLVWCMYLAVMLDMVL